MYADILFIAVVIGGAVLVWKCNQHAQHSSDMDEVEANAMTPGAPDGE